MLRSWSARRAGESDRRAHRLQRWLRAADGDSAAHVRWRLSQSATIERVRVAQRESRQRRPCRAFEVGGEVRQHALAGLRPGLHAGHGACRHHAMAASTWPICVHGAARQRAVVERRARGGACCAGCARCSPCELDDVRLARAGPAGRERLRRCAGRRHGPDGGEPRRRAQRALFLDTRTLRVRAGDAAVRRRAGRHQFRRRAQACGRATTARDARNASAPRRCSACAQLRDLATADLARIAALPEPLDRRARHVVTENQRVLDVGRMR